LNLPTRLPVDPLKVMDGLQKDKKRSGDTIHFVLLHGLGRAVVETISLSDLLRETEGILT